MYNGTGGGGHRGRLTIFMIYIFLLFALILLNVHRDLPVVCIIIQVI